MKITSKSLPEDLTKLSTSESDSVRQLDQLVQLDQLQNDNLHANLNKVPQKILYGYDLKKSKSFRKIRQSYKKKNMKQVFITDLKTILSEYSPEDSENELNDELLVEIMQIAEEYYIYPNIKEERDVLKHDSVIELMLPYFRNDTLLLTNIMGHVKGKVNKLKNWKRMYIRLK